MTFLVLDTSGSCAVLALAENDGLLRAARVWEGRRTLSRRLMGELDGLLTGEKLTLDDLSAFVVGLGPGSFTGVRVGVTTAKTLAQVTGKPLVGVGTLDAYAAGWGEASISAAVLLPSRRGEAYVAVYQNGELTDGPRAVRLEDFAAQLTLQTLLLGATELLPGYDGPRCALPFVPPDGLASLAARRLSADDFDDPLALVPLYVVPPAISAPKTLPAQEPPA